MNETDHERAIRVFERGVGRQDRVVRLNDRVGESRGRVYTELKLGLFAVVGGETLKNESTETGTSSTTKGVENEESLKTVAVISQTAQPVHYVVNLLLSDGVVTAGVCRERMHQSTTAERPKAMIPTVARSILLASDHRFWVEEAPEGTVANLVDDIGLKIDVEGARNVLAR